MITVTENSRLEDFRGIFSDGYTDEDISIVLSQLESILGVKLSCIWDYYDEYGFGGNSNIYEMSYTGIGFAKELSGEWFDFLIHGEGDPSHNAVSDDSQPLRLNKIIYTSANSKNLARDDRS